MFEQIPKNSRYELKFITHDINYSLIKKYLNLSKLVFKKEHQNRFINNIYFDSLDFDSLKSNIYGISSRLKLRYRWYGDLKNSNSGALELKFKRNVFGWKKRFTISNLIMNEKIDWKSIISTIKKFLPLSTKILLENYRVPILINRYEREYYISIDRKIRATIDKKQIVFDQRNFRYPNLRKKTYFQPHIVIEFKYDRNCSKNIQNSLSDFPIRIGRNSKYVNSARSVLGF